VKTFENMKAAVLTKAKDVSKAALFTLLPLLLSALSAHSVVFPPTQEKADLTLSFILSPPEPSSTASGTASIHLRRLAGVEYREPLGFTLSGLPAGTYSVGATTKSGPPAPPVFIGNIVVSADPSAPPPAPLDLPKRLKALDIAMLTVSDATPTVVLTGEPTEDIVKWRFWGDRPLRAPSIPPTGVPPILDATTAAQVRGHVSIQARILDGAELRRVFNLVGRGLPPSSPLSLNLDGVAVREVTTNSRGNIVLFNLNGGFRIAGTHLLTLTDTDGNVVAQADFFPGVN
jgi:hypothetical protein